MALALCQRLAVGEFQTVPHPYPPLFSAVMRQSGGSPPPLTPRYRKKAGRRRLPHPLFLQSQAAQVQAAGQLLYCIIFLAQGRALLKAHISDSQPNSLQISSSGIKSALHKPSGPGCQLFRGGGCFPGGFCALFCGLLRPLLVLPSKPLFLPCLLYTSSWTSCVA